MRIACILFAFLTLAAGALPVAGAEGQPATAAPSTATPPKAPATPEPATPEPAAEVTPPAPEPPVGGTIRGRNLWETFSRGGPLMYPILLCSLLGLAFTIERLVALRQNAVAPRKLAESAIAAVQEGGASPALELCEDRSSSLARVLFSGLSLVASPKEEVVAAMQEAGERELWSLDRLAKPLSIIAGVSPLLGLLGTVWGMILAFDVVAQKGAQGDPKQLANGIATALLTTLAGLMVAIPCYVLYHYFRGKSDRMIIEVEETASRVVAALQGVGTHANPPPPGGERGAAADAAH